MMDWYQGKHKPIITKELFDLVQEQVKNSQLVRKENIEFAFTKIMKCGLCGSGVSETEKFKKQKNGPPKRHVYYGCTKARDKNCLCGYINEDDLIKQLQKLVDEVDLNESSLFKKVEAEVVRYKKFQSSLLGEEVSTTASDINTKDYVKFLLKEGSLEEKREILSCFNSSILLRNKKVFI